MSRTLEDIRLLDFRCFHSLEFVPGDARTFIVGQNARGKTSLLEAICVLLRLQSPRTTAMTETVRSGCAAFAIDGHARGAHLACSWQDGARKIALDSKAQTRSEDYLAVAKIAWFANTDLELVRGGGSVRRRYLDFLGMQSVPGYRAALRSYERALRSRNALLKDNRPRREIAAFDEPLAAAGEVILEARALLCDALAPLTAQAGREISGESDEIEIRFRPGSNGSLRVELERSRPEEERLRQTVVGPHRDDILVRLNAMEASTFASEGQQRTISLALKLAQARHLETVQGAPPLFLLDDVFGELDAARRNRLLACLPRESQVFITTTFLDWAETNSTDAIFEFSESHTISRVRA